MSPCFWRTLVKVLGFSLLAFVLLTIRFSPNWVAFYYGIRDAKASVTNLSESAAVDKAILSGYSISRLLKNA